MTTHFHISVEDDNSVRFDTPEDFHNRNIEEQLRTFTAAIIMLNLEAINLFDLDVATYTQRLQQVLENSQGMYTKTRKEQQ